MLFEYVKPEWANVAVHVSLFSDMGIEVLYFTSGGEM